MVDANGKNTHTGRKSQNLQREVDVNYMDTAQKTKNKTHRRVYHIFKKSVTE